MTDRDELGTQTLGDVQTMRALTHPTRIALIEALGIHGPMTATQAAEHVGESPSSCSFHLRQLARYGFVEEAGGGSGRRRPWKRTRLGISWANVHDDPAVEVAAAALTELFRNRYLGRLQTWMRTRGSYSRAWQQAATSSEYVLWLTPDELQEVSDRIRDLLQEHRERLTDPSLRPAGALPVELLMFGYPMGPES